MADGQPPDIGAFATEIFNDTFAELIERFPGLGELSERDRDAVLAAMGKAAWRGLQRGVALYAHEVNQHMQAIQATNPEAETYQLDTVWHSDPEPDFWADKYGDNG